MTQTLKDFTSVKFTSIKDWAQNNMDNTHIDLRSNFNSRGVNTREIWHFWKHIFFPENCRAKKLDSIGWLLASSRYRNRKVEEAYEKNPAKISGHNSHTLRSYDQTTKQLHEY